MPPRRRPTYAESLAAAERAAAGDDWDAASYAVADAMDRLADGGRRFDVPRLVRIADRVAPHCPVVAMELALIKLVGRGVRPDRKGAELILRRLAHSDELHHAAMAHAHLGNVAGGDYGGKADLPRALRHFEQAARLGSPGAAYNAGVAHRYGIGTPVDLGRAERLLRQALDDTRGPLTDFDYGPDPGVCIELAVLIALKGEDPDESGALEPLDACYEPTVEIRRMRDAILGDDDVWTSGEEFARDYERRTRQRMVMHDAISRCSMFDRTFRCARDVDASRMVRFAETFMGWSLADEDPLAGRFGDRLADAVAGDGTRFPVFAVTDRIDGAPDPMMGRIKTAVAAGNRNAVLLSPFLCLVGRDPDRGALLGFGLLLKDGKWSMFTLSPGGFDRVLAEAGEFERDHAAYIAGNRIPNLPPDLARWMLDGGPLHDMMAAAGIARKRRRWGAAGDGSEPETPLP